ncbi:integumentary mucin C.1-like [Mercenaria mercenaria]|uniref:integumentary mucin C.1-like n=1 Tax=Mercenaria mercenaria TaxID=6596 RepID=UPI00234F57D8|nr:integumentary mucin C.1-like [Mercenaria mercenaria]
MGLREHITLGLFSFILLFSITSISHSAVSADDNDVELLMYRNSYLIHKSVLEALRRFKRGITDLDPGNRATETLPSTTTPTPPPPTNPGVTGAATTASPETKASSTAAKESSTTVKTATTSATATVTASPTVTTLNTTTTTKSGSGIAMINTTQTLLFWVIILMTLAQFI